MQTVLVTGGAGFIGSHLVPALIRRGIAVRVLDTLSPQVHGAIPAEVDWLVDDRIDFVRGSVTDEAVVRRALAGVDAVVHLAAETGTGQSMYEIAQYVSANALGTGVLLNVLASDPNRSVRRIAIASSRSVYGEGAYVCSACSPDRRVTPPGRSAAQLAAHRWDPACTACGAPLTPVPTREDDAVAPASIYAATKFAQEDLVRIAASSLGIDHAILRLQNVYGEGQSLKNPYTGILSIFSTRIRRGLPLPIFEDGQETRDFVHVEDVTNAFIATLTTGESPCGPINVGSGIATTVAEIASDLSVALGAEPRLTVTGDYRIGDIRHNCAEIERLRNALGYTPRIGLAEGLRRFAAWVTTQPLPEDRLEAANAELRQRKLMG